MDLHHLQLGGDEVEDLGDVLADEAERAAAVGAARRDIGSGLVRAVRIGGRVGGGACRLEALERELQLLDLSLDLLRARSEPLLLQARDGDLERLDQRLVGPVGRRDAGDLPMLGKDDRLQGGGVLGQRVDVDLHAAAYPPERQDATSISLNRRSNHTTRAGGAVQAGRRQSIPSHSIASCAEVNRATPSAGDGHGKRPFSSTL